MNRKTDQSQRRPVDLPPGPMPAEPPANPAPPLAGPITWGAVTALLVGLVGRCVITSTSIVEWNASFAGALADGFGPIATTWLNWLMGLTLGLVFVDRLIQRRRVHWWSVGLWSVGVVVWLVHAADSDAALRIGGDWVAATAAGLAALHLAEYRGPRRVMLASIIALAGPLSVQAITQVTYTHAATVANYEQHREQILRQRGWLNDPQAIARYERRLYQAEASGRFGLSNVFGSVMAGLCLLVGAVVAWRWSVPARNQDAESTEPGNNDAPPRAGPWLGRLAWSAVLILSLIGLALSFSKGAVGALVVTMGAMAVAWRLARALGWGRRWWAAVGLGVVALGLAAILLRGAVGPPDSPQGERSLLFRWFYLQASVDMTTEQPILGVGPGHFKGFYLVHKNPLSPEEVSDPHNVLAAWISTLGLGGLAWSIMLIGWLWGAAPPGRPTEASPQASNDRHETAPPNSANGHPLGPWGSLLAAGLVVFGGKYAMDHAVLGPLALAMLAPVAVVLIVAVVWRRSGGLGVAMGLLGAVLAAITILIPFVGFALIGAAGWFALAIGLLRGVKGAGGGDPADHPILLFGVYFAAVAVALHSQIEMTLTNTMAGPLGMVWIGLAAGWSGHWRGLARQRARLYKPRQPGRIPTILLIGIWALVLGLWAWQAVGVGHTLGEYRRARALLEAGRADPALGRLHGHARAALLGAQVHATRSDWAAVSQQLEKAIALASPADRATVYRTAAQLALAAWQATGDRQWRGRLDGLVDQMLRYDPFSTEAHVLAGDAAWQVGRYDQAADRYGDALELDTEAYLDPLTQMSPDERDRLARRIAEADAGIPPTAPRP